MAKGYWIVRLDVDDPALIKEYLAATPGIVDAHGGRFLARAGRYESPEGSTRSRNSVIEFPSYQVALDCYHSPEYQLARRLRAEVAQIDLVILEGVFC